jgi:RNA polymerase sigma factor (sigma-70 family)
MPQPQLSKEQTAEISRLIKQELKYVKCAPEEKDDLFSEAWVRVLRYFGRFDPTKAKLSTYISIHTRGASLDYFRANYNPRHKNIAEYRQRFNSSVSLGINMAENAYSSITDSIALAELMESLPPKDREIMRLYREGNKMREIADKFGVSESRISQRITAIVEGLVSYASE